LRVFEGGQPGYAILVFDQDVDNPSLRLAVRSIHVGAGAYLGANGAFERVAHYFTAVRVTAPKGGFGYQVGPEIVNHLMEDDQIEISVEESGLVETGYWANATPLMTGARGPTPTLLAGGQPPPLVSQLMPGETPAGKKSSESVADTPGGDPKKPDEKAEKPDEQQSQKDPPTPPDRRLWWALGALALIGAAAAGALALSPDLRCSVLSRDCKAPKPEPKPEPKPQPAEPDDAEAARQARDCDAQKTAAGLICDAETACFEPYRRHFPQGPARPEIDRLAAKAAATCSAAESQAYLHAQQCAAAAQPCIAPTCYLDYMQKYSSGSHGQKARDDLAQAKIQCERPSPGPSSDDLRHAGPPPLLDGEYLATGSESLACGVARQRAIHVFVCSGRVRWQHEGRLFANMPSVTLQWEGVIDGAGAVTASVSGNTQLVAKGRITDTERAIEMQYPACGETIALTITRELSAGCAAR
jgi:hypothetical protein